MEQRIRNAMQTLGLTEQEAKEMFADDADIEKGVKKDFDLTPEQEANSKKARQTTGMKKPMIPDLKPRKRKENLTKRDLINYLNDCMMDYSDANKVEVANPERIISFIVGEENFEIILQQKRKPKV